MAENLPVHEITPVEETSNEASMSHTEIIAPTSSNPSDQGSDSFVQVAADNNVNPGSERSVEISSNLNRRQLGGIRTMPYIFANEIGEVLASAGINSNLQVYLGKEFNLPLVKTSNIIACFHGISNVLPILGGLIADSFAGRFWTIVVASSIYELGLIGLLLSALIPSLRPSPCPSQEDCQQPSNLQLWVLYTFLLLTSIGSGGLRPCLSTFTADQIDMRKASVEARRWNFFNWYSFGMNLAALTALTILVYIQEKCGWGWGLGVPTVVWVISIIAFVVGSPLYLKVRPGGSPLIRLAQVGVAAFKKRTLALPGDSSLLYRNRELDASISVGGLHLHSNQFKWLDKAALTTQDEQTDLRKPNLWRLNTVHRVEELKSIIRILPIMASRILPVVASSNLQTYFTAQARTMNRHITHSFQIPPTSLQVSGVLTVMIGLVVYERALMPMARRFTKKPAGMSPIQRIGIGMFIHIIGTLVSAAVETKRKNIAADHNLMDSPHATIPISFLWLLPQLIVHGIAEVFSSAGYMEFLYSQSPESLRSVVQGLSGIMGGIGSFLGIYFFRLVRKLTAPDVWLTERNMNRGKLDSFYYLVTVINVVNFVYYLTVAWFYVQKPLESEINDADDEQERDAENDEEDA